MDNAFRHSADKINQMIDEQNVRPVCMNGVRKDLETLKPLIEQLYNDHVFYLSCWISECGFHGWSWDKDNGRLTEQEAITDGITEKFKEIYALILAGLGEHCETSS